MRVLICTLFLFLSSMTNVFSQKDDISPAINYDDNVICDTIVVCYSCCFEYEAVPKFFPPCFGECSGNWDNVLEILQFPCDDLPEGVTSAFTNITINNAGTFGNCNNCSNPQTYSNEPVNSFNMAVCGPGNHSVSFDISLYNSAGNLIGTCPNNYFSFEVPACEFFDNDDIVIFPNPSSNKVYWQSKQVVRQIEILNAHGDVMKSLANPGPDVSVDDLETGEYLIRFIHEDGSSEVRKFVKE